MPANLATQSAAMNHLAWQITYEWNRAKNEQKTMPQMHLAWDTLTQSAKYQCLAQKRKETIFFLWHHTRTCTLAQNEIHGRWLHGKFYANWCDLPEKYKRDDSLLRTLPSGHFWLDGKGRPTAMRYFIASDCAGEDTSHFLARVSLPIIAKH